MAKANSADKPAPTKAAKKKSLVPTIEAPSIMTLKNESEYENAKELLGKVNKKILKLQTEGNKESPADSEVLVTFQQHAKTLAKQVEDYENKVGLTDAISVDDAVIETAVALSEKVLSVANDAHIKYFITQGKTLNKKTVVQWMEKKAGWDDGEPGKKESKREPHADLKKAMQCLAIHCAVIMDIVSVKKVSDIKNYDPALVDGIQVKGFHVMGEEEMTGFVLSFSRKLSFGGVGNLNTPLIRNVEGEEAKEGYVFIDDLIEKIQQAQDQFVLYINGKSTPNAQLGLFDKSEEER